MANDFYWIQIVKWHLIKQKIQSNIFFCQIFYYGLILFGSSFLRLFQFLFFLFFLLQSSLFIFLKIFLIQFLQGTDLTFANDQMWPFLPFFLPFEKFLFACNTSFSQKKYALSVRQPNPFIMSGSLKEKFKNLCRCKPNKNIQTSNERKKGNSVLEQFVLFSSFSFLFPKTWQSDEANYCSLEVFVKESTKKYLIQWFFWIESQNLKVGWEKAHESKVDKRFAFFLFFSFFFLFVSASQTRCDVRKIFHFPETHRWER